jgi:hypothetical protein
MFQSPSKFNQNGIFGLKINHLATLQLLFTNGSQRPVLKWSSSWELEKFKICLCPT